MAIPALIIVVIPLVYLWVFQPPQVACILEQNGELIKAWGTDCDDAKIRLIAK